MRNIPGAALTLLTGGRAIESCIIVAVQWGTTDSTIRYYADKTIEEAGISGQIVQLGTFDDVTKSDQSGAASTVEIVLSDLDGDLEYIFNNTDIHLKPVQLYQWFVGLAINTKFLILDGQLNTPIAWNEGERTLSFTVVNKVEDFEIGFSAEEGNFPSVSPSLIGTPWPMLFGYVLHYPGLKLTEIPSAFTAEPFGIVDRSLTAEIGTITSHVGALKDAQAAALVAAIQACWNEVWEGSLSGQSIFDVDCNDSPDVKRYNDQAVQYGNQANQEAAKLTDLQTQLQNQTVWQRSSVKIITQTDITQPFKGVVRIGNQMFHATIAAHGDLRSGRLDCTPIITQPIAVNGNPTVDVQTVIQPQGFQFYNSGTQVQLASPYPITFVVSIVPGIVKQVWAYRSLNGLKQLVPVPSSYYTVQTQVYGTISAVCVVLHQPLSSINFTQNLGVQNWENAFGQFLPPHIVPVIDWEDDIYVTFDSDVGPNTCDIIQYFVDHYAIGLTTDTDSFAAVRTLLTNYPMNFGIASRDNVIQVISDLAYQARCALYIKNNVIYIKYLPIDEESVDSISESDCEVDTLEVSCTPTENIVTKYIGTYRPDYTPTYSQPVQITLRYNINKYGVHESSHDYYAYRDFYEAQKSSTFWMIRTANTWKILKCKLMLTKLNLETFDTVTLAFNNPYVADGPVKAIVQSAKYNSVDNTIDAEFWVAVRLGEMKQYKYAWPAGMSESDFFPPHDDITAGQSGGINGGVQGVLPPSNSLQINVAPIPQGGAVTPLGNGMYQNDGRDVIAATPDVELEPIPVEAPIMDPYQYPVLKDPGVIPTAISSAVYPGTIDAFSHFADNGQQVYNCTAYPAGIKNQGKPIPACIQLQMDRNYRIPPGTWTLICITAYKDDEGPKREATVQIPVWLL